MLLVGKKDYYDVIAKTAGIDKTVIYQRSGEPVVLKEFDKLCPTDSSFPVTRRGITYRFTFYKLIIGFCGKLYPLVQAKIALDKTGSTPSTYTFYSAKDLAAFLKSHKITQEATDYSFWRMMHVRVTSTADMKEFFQVQRYQSMEGLFRRFNVPVFIIGKDYHPKWTRNEVVLTPNPQLKDYHFQKIADPVTAWQSIYSYISGVLGVPTRQIVVVDDKIKAKKLGHDGPYSFRKAPTKNKRKKK